jgi:hypothetical protein
VDLVWRPGGSRVVVLTALGFMHFYDLVESDGKLIYERFVLVIDGYTVNNQ